MPPSPPDPSAGERFLEPYREALRRHGPGFEATLWGSRSAQQLRFDVFIDLAGFTGCTIVDAGCGTGDFAARLLEREVDFAGYVGLDALPPVIQSARERGLDPGRERVRFEVADLVADPGAIAPHRPDYTCFSGTLNTMDDATARRVVGGAFEASAQGVIFNFLSDRCHARWADRDLAPARRFDTVAWLDWALGRTSRVAFTQAYLDGHDATISMWHE